MRGADYYGGLLELAQKFDIGLVLMRKAAHQRSRNEVSGCSRWLHTNLICIAT